MIPLLQLVVLLFSSLLVHIGTTNPNRSSTGDYVQNEGFGSSYAIFLAPTVGKILVWSSTLYQVVYLYLQASSPASISTLFPEISTFINCLPLTAISMLGYIFIIIGGLGRFWCYRTLGTFFTFELTIRHSHKLIKTGPYAYVRHPSYTFAFIMMIGIFLVHQRLTNFFPEKSWIQIPVGPVGFLTCCIMLALALKKRVRREEEGLQKTFGNEWTEYVSKTNKFIPNVI